MQCLNVDCHRPKVYGKRLKVYCKRLNVYGKQSDFESRCSSKKRTYSQEIKRYKSNTVWNTTQ